MSTITISIPEQLRRFMTAQMRKNGFDNVSEYFRTLLRESRAKEANERLEAHLLEGLNSKDYEVSDSFWKELRTETKDLIKKHARKKAKSAK